MSTELKPQTELSESQKLDQWAQSPQIQNKLTSALGGVIDVEFFTANMLITLASAEYRDVSNADKAMKIFECAELGGLLPSSHEVALVPYKMTQGPKAGQTILETTVQWQGFHKIILRHPDVLWLEARLVYAGDEFEFDGTTHRVTRHQYNPFEGREVLPDFSNLRGGYLKCTLQNGHEIYSVTTKDYILKARACAQTRKIWDAWTVQMCLKTVYREAFARRAVPVDEKITKLLTKAIEREDLFLENDPMRAISPPAQPQRSLTDLSQMIEADYSKQVAKSEKEPEPANAVEAQPAKPTAKGKGKTKQNALIPEGPAETTAVLLARCKTKADVDRVAKELVAAGRNSDEVEKCCIDREQELDLENDQ